MFRVTQNQFWTDFVIVFVIAFFIFAIAFALSRFRPLPSFVSSLSGTFRQSYNKVFVFWFVLIFAVYIFSKLVLYFGLWSQVEVKVDYVNKKIEYRQPLTGLYLWRNRPGIPSYSIKYSSPLYRAELSGREYEFTSERMLSVEDVLSAVEQDEAYYDFACRFVWDEPSSCDFAGLYFFRHDVGLIVLFLFSLWGLFRGYSFDWLRMPGSGRKVDEFVVLSVSFRLVFYFFLLLVIPGVMFYLFIVFPFGLLLGG